MESNQIKDQKQIALLPKFSLKTEWQKGEVKCATVYLSSLQHMDVLYECG